VRLGLLRWSSNGVLSKKFENEKGYDILFRGFFLIKFVVFGRFNTRST
jgi:hypothetical protein